MRRSRAVRATASAVLSMALVLPIWGSGAASGSAGAEEWSRFRGPNGLGVAETGPLPAELGPHRNVLWKTPTPRGHSSPVIAQGRIFLTGVDGEQLVTLALDVDHGEVLWRRVASRPRREKLDPRNGPASPTPVSNGAEVFVFFPEYGLLAYNRDGQERWRRPLGPFNNLYGMGASPILVDDKVVLVLDQNTDSSLIALGKDDGRITWQVPRPEAKSGHSTPVVFEPAGGPPEVLVPGSFFLTAYAATTGEKLWWVRGLSFEMKSTPVLAGGVVYINGYGSPLNEPGVEVRLPAFAQALGEQDTNGDGRLTGPELRDENAKAWFDFVDLDGSGALDGQEWSYLRAALESRNGLLAIDVGGSGTPGSLGDRTANHIRWRYHDKIPQLPSPLLYRGVLYMVNDRGIATSLEPDSGAVIAQGRIQGAVDSFYASPVASDGKVFMAGRSGKVAVLGADGHLPVLAVNDLEDQITATPAIAHGRIYLRTRGALYCFGLKARPPPAPEGVLGGSVVGHDLPRPDGRDGGIGTR